MAMFKKFEFSQKPLFNTLLIRIKLIVSRKLYFEMSQLTFNL